MTPYARQCGPPELLATLPPIEHDCWLDGSGAKWTPWGASARVTIEVEHARARPRRRPYARSTSMDAVHLRRRRSPPARRRAPRHRRGRCPHRGDERRGRGHARRARTPAPPRSSRGSTRPRAALVDHRGVAGVERGVDRGANGHGRPRSRRPAPRAGHRDRRPRRRASVSEACRSSPTHRRTPRTVTQLSRQRMPLAASLRVERPNENEDSVATDDVDFMTPHEWVSFDDETATRGCST